MSSSDDDLISAVMAASRALVAIAAVSIDASPVDVTLHQYRALVVLATQGPQRMAQLGDALRMSPSSVTRLVERIERKGLAVRRTSPESRRSVELALTRDGRALVDEVMGARRNEISAVLDLLPLEDRQAVREAFEAFAKAAGEPLHLGEP